MNRSRRKTSEGRRYSLSAIDCVVKLETKGGRGVLAIDAKFLHYKEY